MKRFLLAAIFAVFFAGNSSPEYSIQAIRYGVSPGFSVAGLVVGAPKGEKVDIAMVIWLIRGGGRTILFDSGFHREKWLKYFPMTDYLRPDEAVKLAGVKPEEVTDIVISHAHWDHMGGIDLFPKANVWIQKEEYRYYTGDAWQPGGNHGGIDPEDVKALLQVNTEGRLRLVDGDNVEIFPGIRAYTGGATYLCFGVFARRGRANVCAGVGQLLLVPEPCGACGERHVQRGGPCREYCGAGADD